MGGPHPAPDSRRGRPAAVRSEPPVQGTAADLIKMAMVNVKKRIEEESLDAALILQVHDELILEVAEQDAEKARLVLEEEMENAITLDVPILASSKIGKTWGDLK